MMLKIRMGLIIIILGLITLILLPIQSLIVIFLPRYSHIIAKLWHKIVLFLIGIRLQITGAPVENEPTLWLANHVSWSDIPVLGAILPAYFVAKQDMSSWPMIGFLAKSQNTIFVNRDVRSTVIGQAEAIAKKLRQGHSVILFPEGTTTDGMHLYPFKSALLGGANMALGKQYGRKTNVQMDTCHYPKTIKIQPITLSYKALYGIRLGRFGLPHVAWPGSIELMPHLKNVIKQGAFDVEVHFGEPIDYRIDSDRKQVTQQVKTSIGRELIKGLRG